MNRKQLNKQFKWTPGWKMTIGDWINATDRRDVPEIRNIHHALRFSVSTGRLPNWVKTRDGKVFTKKNSCEPMSNTQQRRAIVTAILTQENTSTDAGVKALQAAFGVAVK